MSIVYLYFVFLLVDLFSLFLYNLIDFSFLFFSHTYYLLLKEMDDNSGGGGGFKPCDIHDMDYDEQTDDQLNLQHSSDSENDDDSDDEFAGK